jgi:uncharacterized repeat protein (TIGR02543 family)
MKYRLLQKLTVLGMAGALALSALYTPITSRAADQSLIGQEQGVSNGASMDYTVPYTGVYSIFIRGGIGGCDGSFPMYAYYSSDDNKEIGLGGKGAGMAFRLHLTKGTVVQLVSGERGQWSCEVSDDTATRGGSGIGTASGGNGHWSGGGGGASGISINGQIIAIAAGGGGANWWYGEGGRKSDNVNSTKDYTVPTGENGVRWAYKMDTGGGGGGWVGGKTGNPEGAGQLPGAYGGRSGYDWNRLPSNAYYVDGSIAELGGARGDHITYRQFYLTYGILYPTENGYQPTDRSFAYGTDGGGWAGITPVSFDPENATIRVIAGTGIREVWFTDTSARGRDISQSYPIGSRPGLDGDTYTGYHFVNWTKNGSVDSTTWPYYITVQEGGGTWTANGAPNTYSIAYNLNGGSYGTYHPTSATYDAAFTVSLPSRTGYTFAGWTITGMDGCTHYFGSTTSAATSVSSRKDTSYKNLRSTSGTVTFTAVWTANGYSIAYNLNGGSYGTYHPTSATYNNVFRVSNPTKNGYTFQGWTITGMDSCDHYYGTNNNPTTKTNATSLSGRKEEYYKNLRSTSGTVTFTAVWTANTGTITYSNNKTTNNRYGDAFSVSWTAGTKAQA